MLNEPGHWAQRIEQQAQVPEGDTERFAGYAIMALPFSSGQILALRRWTATSISSAQTTVWHRSADGLWSFYSNVAPVQSCARYFSSALAKAAQIEIELAWQNDRTLRIRIGGDVELDWQVEMAPTGISIALNAAADLVPEPVWRQRWFLSMMGRVAGAALGAGSVRLNGRVPNGQYFLANPRRIWMVSDSRASLGGRDLGPAGPLAEQAHLADFWIPQRGIFAVAQTFLEPYDATRHILPVAGQPPSLHLAAGPV